MAEKRIRSPNYPALSLPDAISKVASIYRELHSQGAPREDIAKAMGYNTLNGASATAISALHKYGLLEGGGNSIKVSDRSLRILHPHSPEEKARAVEEAAHEPPLFLELARRFPGGIRNLDLARNYLIRSGFAPSAVSAVIEAYRETSELVGGREALDDSSREPQERDEMSTPLRTGDHDAMPEPPRTMSAPFRVAYTGTAIEVSGKATNTKEADAMVKAIQALRNVLQELEISSLQDRKD